MPKILVKLKAKVSDTGLPLTIFGPVLEAKEPVFFWQKSALEIAETTNGLFEHICNIQFGSRSPYAFAEYLRLILDSQAARPKNWWLAKSFGVQDFYHPDYLPLNGLVPKITEEIAREILLKFGAQQLVILDLDSDQEGTIYRYNYQNGLIKLDLDSTSEGSKELILGQLSKTIHSAFPQPTIPDLITANGVKRIAELLNTNDLDDQPTLWLFSGEIVSSSNANIFALLVQLFALWRGDLPTLNYFAIDKYQILNYLQKFPLEFLQHNFSVLFDLLPLNLVNSQRLPNSSEITLIGKEDAYSLPIKVKLQKEITVGYYPEEKSLFGIKNLLTLPGLVWFWQGNELQKQPLAKLLDRFPEKRVISKIQLTHEFTQLKNGHWQLELPANSIAKITRLKKLVLPEGNLVQISRTRLQLLSKKQAPRLLVTAGQQVAQSELLTSERKPLIAAEASNIYFGKNKGKNETLYLKFRSEAKFKKDLAWIERANLQLQKVVEHTLWLDSLCLATPLATVVGKSQSGLLVFTEDFVDGLKTAENLAGLILAINQPLNRNQILQLWEAGATSLLLPSIDLDFISSADFPPEIWSEVSIAAVAYNSKRFSEAFRKLILQHQAKEVFVDRVSLELKYLPETGEAKFHLTQPLFADDILRKGTMVHTLRERNFLQTAVIQHREGKKLILKQTETAKLLTEDLENVTLR